MARGSFLLGAVCLAGLVAAEAAGSVHADSNPTDIGKPPRGAARPTTLRTVATGNMFVELVFSRTEVTAADNGCQPADVNVARLDTVVEPYLRSLGLAATGSIETAPTQLDTFWCAHYNETLATSWALAQNLSADGWTFPSHSRDYPLAARWSRMTAAQQWDETCGSAQTIDAHGLTGASDMFMWPDNVVNTNALVNYVEPCFGTNRIYGKGVTAAAQIDSAPYQQSVRGLSGGYCNVSSAPCHSVPGAIVKYSTPASVIRSIQALAPGQVLTLQSYLNVTGANPAYTTNADRWDCTSSDPNLHWANDSERYCWSDLQTILSYLATSGIGITQPGIVEAAFGRVGYSDHAVPRPTAPTRRELA